METKKNNVIRLKDVKWKALESYNLDNQIGFLLRKSYQRHTALFMDEMNEFGLTSPQFAAMVKLLERGTISQNSLGRLISTDPATTQGIVKRLKARDLIKLEKDLHDKRMFRIALSPKGKKFIKTTLNKATTVTEKTLEPLNKEEQATLLALIRKIV